MKFAMMFAIAGCVWVAAASPVSAQAKPAAIEVLDAHVARAPKAKSSAKAGATAAKKSVAKPVSKGATITTDKTKPAARIAPPVLNVKAKATKRTP